MPRWRLTGCPEQEEGRWTRKGAFSLLAQGWPQGTLRLSLSLSGDQLGCEEVVQRYKWAEGGSFCFIKNGGEIHISKINHFKVYISVPFSTFTLCNHYLCLVIKYCHYPKGNLVLFSLAVMPHPPCSWPLATFNLHFVPTDLLFTYFAYFISFLNCRIRQ